MRKYVKILLLLILITMVVFTFSASVNAADTIDYSGYEDLDGEDNKQATDNQNKVDEGNKSNANKENAVTETKNPANTATTEHPQTGAFTNAVCIGVAGIATAAMVVGYKKMKKYNF